MAEEMWSDPTASVLGGDLGGWLSYPAADVGLTVTPVPAPPAPAVVESAADPWTPSSSPYRQAPIRPGMIQTTQQRQTWGAPPRPAQTRRAVAPAQLTPRSTGVRERQRGSGAPTVAAVVIIVLVVGLVVLIAMG